MLQHDRHARPTVREALQHDFNQQSYEAERLSPQRQHDPRFKEALAVRERLVDTFRAVAHEPILKRVSRLAMAHACDVCVEELAAERFVFRMLDRRQFRPSTFRGLPPLSPLAMAPRALDFNARRTC